MTQEQVALDESIDELYRAFAGHRLRAWTDPCLACCATREEEEALHAAPLRQLTKDTIQPYAANAMTTWGDDRELRYFLPRLLEIVAGEDFGWPDPEVLLHALRTAVWTDWPTDERVAVAEFLVAWWRHTLSVSRPVHAIDVVLCAIGRAAPSLAFYLDAWDADARATATDHLIELLDEHWSPEHRRLLSSFWDRPDLDLELVAWLRTEAVVERLTEAATDPLDPHRATRAGWALARLP